MVPNLFYFLLKNVSCTEAPRHKTRQEKFPNFFHHVCELVSLKARVAVFAQELFVVLDPIGIKKELIHYGISNIQPNDDDLYSYDTWCHYLPPIPAKGSGYHRLVRT